jgi:hypothetical protein
VRLLSFAPSSVNRRYRLCYDALVMSQAPLERAEFRAHGTLLTKLETIGEVRNPARGVDELPLYHSEDGGAVSLEEQEYEILKRFLSHPSTLAGLSRGLTREWHDLLDWVDAQPNAKP